MDQAKFLIWNVRGLNDRARRDNVRKVVDCVKPAVVCLQETKLSYISDWEVRSFLGRVFSKFVYLPAQATRGGILVAWREDFTGIQWRVHRHSVSVKFSEGTDQERAWWFTGVYGPHLDSEKAAFLEELREVRSLCAGPWMLAGDFNMIYAAEDKNNENLNRAMMGRFRRFVNDMDVKEVPLLGRRYTWSNERHSPTLVKLDRVLCTADWEAFYPDCILQSQATELSDHCPLVLGLREGVHGKRRFHFESYWPKLDGFHGVVQQSWAQPVTATCPVERISLKLKRLARALQSWSEKEIGHVKIQHSIAREILHRLEIAQDSRPLNVYEDWLRGTAKRHCLVMASLDRTIARLRSRVRFLKDGDANTALFHSQAGFRKKKNFIPKLMTEDQVVTSQAEKEEVMFNYFNEVLGTASPRESTLDLSFFHREGLDLSALEAPITEDEVWATIKAMPSDRAPGPDGYTGRFYKSCWQIIKWDFMAAIITLQQGDARKLWLLNSAYLTLIPKKIDALLAKDFRPISLIHSFAKLIAKILANRLAPYLNTMVSTNQSAFIRGRCIHDNYMLVQQTIRLLYRRRVPSIFLKLDISKAFDSVSWGFLLEILTHLGFGPSWCNLISNLLRTASTRVLVNGQPGDEIRHQRGLRQGDPLSPMLFILVMDVLNSMFTKASNLGLLQPIEGRNPDQRISLYADDVALFIRPVEDDMNLTLAVLEKFGTASGLLTNLQKSCVIPIRCDQQELESIDNTLPCTRAAFPTTYLGLPISDRKLRKSDLLPWVEKIGDKLPGWQASLMNMAGRTTWVRFVLSAIPIHALIAINVPKWFIKAVDKLRRAFIWKGRDQVNGGSCLVAWDKVQRPLELGGLGVLNLELMSWSLQIRWLWLKKTDPNRPWQGLQINVHPNAVALFDIALSSQVGNGANTLFWSDRWLMGNCIADLAPEVVAAVPQRIRSTRTVAEALMNNSWPTDIQGGLSMVGQYDYFILSDVIQDIALSLDEDQHTWKFEAAGTFTSRSAYRAFFNGSTTFEPWRLIWKTWAPGKCKIFLWLAIRNRCWTADRLQKRGLEHPDKCVLCDQEEETAQHILTSCVFARQFWHEILAPLGLADRAPRLDDCTFAKWWRKASKRTPKDKRKGFNSVVVLGAWMLWKHRNAGVFEHSNPNIHSLVHMFKEEAHLWSLAGARGLRALGTW